MKCLLINVEEIAEIAKDEKKLKENYQVSVMKSILNAC